MSESLAIGVLLMLIFGAASVYLYSRITYTEKRLGMMESLLVDIKMIMESASQEAAPMPFASVYAEPLRAPLPVPAPVPVPVPVPAPALESEDESAYKALLEASEPVLPAEPQAVNYDTMSRADLSALAEQRGTRVTKRMGRGDLISLLRKSDASKNDVTTGEDAVPEPAGGDLSVDTGNAGAELEETAV